MPCRVDIPPTPDDYYHDFQKVSRLLCGVMKFLEDDLETSSVYNLLVSRGDGLLEWWEAHKEADRLRQERAAKLAKEEAERRAKARASAAKAKATKQAKKR